MRGQLQGDSLGQPWPVYQESKQEGKIMKFYNMASYDIPLHEVVEFPCALGGSTCNNFVVDKVKHGIYTIKNSTTREQVVSGWANVMHFVRVRN